MMTLNNDEGTMTVTLSQDDHYRLVRYLDKYRSIFFDESRTTHDQIVDMMNKLSWQENVKNGTAIVVGTKVSA